MQGVLPAVAFRRGLLLGEYALCTECAPLRSCHRDGKRENGLHEDLVSSENLPLRGTLLAEQSLFEDAPGFRNSLEPHGKDLNDIRNCLEHRYLKLHLHDWCGSEPEPWLQDPLS